MNDTALYRTIWRWHFYAGLFVIPMILILILSVTGAIYLFKPQVERWGERAWQNLPVTSAVSPNIQADAALAAFPDSQFHSYRLPERPGVAAMIHLALADGSSMRDVFVSPQGKDWTIGGRVPDSDEHAMHTEHDHEAMMRMQAAGIPMASLADVGAKAQALHLAFPVIGTPPGAPQRFGATPDITWTARSDAQNRPLRITVKYEWRPASNSCVRPLPTSIPLIG